MSRESTSPGLFFNIHNPCDVEVSGFVVGDKLYLLEIGTASFMRPVFQCSMQPGETVQVMTGAGSDGNGVVLFVPPVQCGAQAVQMTVRPNETVDVPTTFCGCSGRASSDLLTAD